MVIIFDLFSPILDYLGFGKLPSSNTFMSYSDLESTSGDKLLATDMTSDQMLAFGGG